MIQYTNELSSNSFFKVMISWLCFKADKGAMISLISDSILNSITVSGIGTKNSINSINSQTRALYLKSLYKQHFCGYIIILPSLNVKNSFLVLGS
mmetsp:Transcript_26208/g.25810  ORF Transcript_26208/g.25810 Transcript_26208/m.25810 type:complete len:95 (+) Transcript_26208:2-286(+)